MEKKASELEGDLLALERSEPKEGVPPRLHKAGSAAREKLGRQMSLLSDRLAPPQKADTRSAEEYHSAMMKRLQNTVQKFGRAKMYTAALFPREVEMINSDLGSISRHLSDLGEMISEREARLEKFGQAAALASQIRQKIAALGAGVEERRRRLAALEEMLSGDLADLKEKLGEIAGRAVEIEAHR